MQSRTACTTRHAPPGRDQPGPSDTGIPTDDTLEQSAARAAARSAAELILIAGGIGMLYNERSYDGRRGEAERDDDDGRGW